MTSLAASWKKCKWRLQQLCKSSRTCMFYCMCYFNCHLSFSLVALQAVSCRQWNFALSTTALSLDTTSPANPAEYRQTHRQTDAQTDERTIVHHNIALRYAYTVQTKTTNETQRVVVQRYHSFNFYLPMQAAAVVERCRVVNCTATATECDVRLRKLLQIFAGHWHALPVDPSSTGRTLYSVDATHLVARYTRKPNAWSPT